MTAEASPRRRSPTDAFFDNLRAARTIAVLVAVLVLVGCSSDSNSNAQTLCSTKDKFQSSVQAMKNVDVVKNGTAALQTSYDQVKKDGDAFIKAAKSSYSQEASNLETAISQLGDALKSAGANGVQPVATAALGVQTSGTALIDKVKSNECK